MARQVGASQFCLDLAYLAAVSVALIASLIGYIRCAITITFAFRLRMSSPDVHL